MTVENHNFKGPIMLLGFQDEMSTAVLERDGYSYIVRYIRAVHGASSDLEPYRITALTDWDGETFQVVDARNR